MLLLVHHHDYYLLSNGLRLLEEPLEGPRASLHLQLLAHQLSALLVVGVDPLNLMGKRGKQIQGSN